MWFGDMAGCIYNHFVLEADVSLVLDSARRPPSSPPVTGPVKSAPTLSPGLLTTWLMLRPLPWVLNTFRENVSVARRGTLTTVVTWSPPSSLWPCLSLLVSL